MFSTQDDLKITDIKSDMIFLSGGSVSLVMKTSAVNFGLLSEEEQVAIIYSFAGLLNSLSFPIQIVIRSEKLDVSDYLMTLNRALSKQKNPLLAQMIGRYREFVKSLIKENEVLDKQFYICINVSGVELGLLHLEEEMKIKKAAAMLMPRRDHLIRQLSRVGVKAKQQTTEELITLFYDIYNGTGFNEESSEPIQPEPNTPARPIAPPQPRLIPIQSGSDRDQPSRQPMVISRIPVRPPTQLPAPIRLGPAVQRLTPWPQPQYPYALQPPQLTKLANPYVVEELAD